MQVPAKLPAYKIEITNDVSSSDKPFTANVLVSLFSSLKLIEDQPDDQPYDSTRRLPNQNIF